MNPSDSITYKSEANKPKYFPTPKKSMGPFIYPFYKPELTAPKYIPLIERQKPQWRNAPIEP